MINKENYTQIISKANKIYTGYSILEVDGDVKVTGESVIDYHCVNCACGRDVTYALLGTHKNYGVSKLNMCIDGYTDNLKMIETPNGIGVPEFYFVKINEINSECFGSENLPKLVDIKDFQVEWDEFPQDYVPSEEEKNQVTWFYFTEFPKELPLSSEI